MFLIDMKYGLEFPNTGIYSDVHLLTDLAQQAEEAGWDGMFLWDTLHYNAEDKPVCDPFFIIIL